MRVSELAKDLKVGSDDLIVLLRKMGIPVPDAEHPLDDASVNSVRTRVERERRAGHKGSAEALTAAIADAQVAPRRRRRRRAAATPKPEPEAAPSEEAEEAQTVAESEESPVEEAADQPVAEAEDVASAAETGFEGDETADAEASVEVPESAEEEETAPEEPARGGAPCGPPRSHRTRHLAAPPAFMNVRRFR